MNEAKNRYALWGSELRQLALEKVQLGSVVEAGPRNPTILLPERFVVRLARHIHGGQVGVNNAQATRVQAQDLLPIPAADDEGHYRRNLLRAKFMERGVFPAEDLRFVEQYIYVPAYLDLDAYEYDNQRYTFGPWVTMNEAKNRYALIAAQINDAELLGHWLGSVVEAAPRNPTRLMPERLVVRFARQIHGGQEGVERAHSLVPPHELLPIL
ncbi:hypothetical protein BGX33_010040 [Mortierella sp. NVP41]|nr:hypothetical protein BGX33_010040 [Mortierella sp. NVP41]